MSFIVLEVHLSREGGREGGSFCSGNQTDIVTHSLVASMRACACAGTRVTLPHLIRVAGCHVIWEYEYTRAEIERNFEYGVRRRPCNSQLH